MTFDLESVADLSSPASRYLRHAIALGTPIARRVAMTMEGQFRLGGSWRQFEATEVLAAQWDSSESPP
ncbi:DUF6544 family protein [Halopiger aswanensis]|uniref:DUF6544 family protein n=1 Tax=Halopiger aswanensis TaxID=148449 RepID=UPI003742B85F